MPDLDGAYTDLEAAGLLDRSQGTLRTTRRWQAAMARAALRLHESGAPWMDLRLPVVAALMELVPCDDEALVRYTAAMLSVESTELARPRGGTETDAP
ncbi:MAG TPA: hypothetical protein VFK85_12905 [Anaeromyxobacteraceae bacterium]|nr:hypothetical protein [Anaeromyxobacteraceae bacterium]